MLTVDPELASSIEGGDLDKGVRFCVPSTENGWQGGTMSSYFKQANKNFVDVGEKFVVRIVGWDCTRQEPDSLAKPQEVGPQSNAVNTPGAITVGGGKCEIQNIPVENTYVTTVCLSESMYRSWDSQNPDKKMLVMPLGDLSPGR